MFLRRVIPVEPPQGGLYFPLKLSSEVGDTMGSKDTRKPHGRRVGTVGQAYLAALDVRTERTKAQTERTLAAIRRMAPKSAK